MIPLAVGVVLLMIGVYIGARIVVKKENSEHKSKYIKR